MLLLWKITTKLRRVYDCLNSLEEGKLFSTLDANSECWHIIRNKKDVDRTATIARSRVQKYTRISFGFKNHSAAFQRFMNVLLAFVKS